MTAGRSLFGVAEPCYTGADTLVDNNICSATPLVLSDLTDATNLAAPAPKGWWIGLDAAATGFGSERVTGAPTALTGGAVSFTTFKPSTDLCQQGSSYLWLVKYDNGGSAATLQGKALVQLSNGSSAEFSLGTLTDKAGRRSQGMVGKAGGMKLITNSGLKPLKKIIHIQER
jgi:type IV pilus assembly protein PilY1